MRGRQQRWRRFAVLGDPDRPLVHERFSGCPVPMAANPVDALPQFARHRARQCRLLARPQSV